VKINHAQAYPNKEQKHHLTAMALMYQKCLNYPGDRVVPVLVGAH